MIAVETEGRWFDENNFPKTPYTEGADVKPRQSEEETTLLSVENQGRWFDENARKQLYREPSTKARPAPAKPTQKDEEPVLLSVEDPTRWFDENAFPKTPYDKAVPKPRQQEESAFMTVETPSNWFDENARKHLYGYLTSNLPSHEIRVILISVYEPLFSSTTGLHKTNL